MKKIILITALLLLASCGAGTYDEFAKCLTEKGAAMYGAFWCGHCNAQKEMFGASWKHINYVECSTPDGKGQTDICKEKKIKGYPTWIFNDDERVSGKLSFEELSKKTGCQV